MKEVSTLSPNEKSRLYAGLRQDREYVKNRNLLLLVSVGSAIGLCLFSFLMNEDIVSQDGMYAAMIVSTVVYMYMITRFTRVRKTVLARLMTGDIAKSEVKAKKKDLKKQAKVGK